MSGILVLGLGNVLLQDDGLGVHAVEEMHRRYHLPDHVQVLDGDVRGLSLLPYLESVSHLLLIDAIDAGDIPGALVCLTAEELSLAFGPRMSCHEASAIDLLWAARATGCYPNEVVVWGIQPGCVDVGSSLTSAVQAQLDQLLRHVLAQLGRWGIAVEDRPT